MPTVGAARLGHPHWRQDRVKTGQGSVSGGAAAPPRVCDERMELSSALWLVLAGALIVYLLVALVLADRF